jgi:N,N'-diacetyllegionaminate synthase
MTTLDFLGRAGTVIIAEVGSNHTGDAGLAREAVAAAKEAGADIVKFQMYKAEELVDATMPVLKYIAQTHKTQRERFKSLQLQESVFADLARLSADAGLGFMVTPFYEDAVDFLDPLVPAFKVASGDMTHLPLLRKIAATGKPVFMSTGLSTLPEIDWAVTQMPKERLHLLHCIGAYPTPDAQVNLNTIPFMAERYGIPVGFSDHTRGTTASVAAVACGATAIEKHFLPRVDAKVADKDLSVGVADFRRMVDEIRRVEAMRGGKAKILQPDEQYFCTTLRRSLYARADIPAGAALSADNMIPLRPWSAEAVSPMQWDEMIGRKVKRPIASGKSILLSDLA